MINCLQRLLFLIVVHSVYKTNKSVFMNLEFPTSDIKILHRIRGIIVMLLHPISMLSRERPKSTFELSRFPSKHNAMRFKLSR